MKRRTAGKINPILIAFLIPLVVILAAVIFMVARNRLHHSLEAFNEDTYHRSPNDLQGNHYNLDAQVDSLLAWDEGVGRIIAVKPVDPGDRLDVYVPETVASDLHVGQRFHMKVLVKDKGLIQVEDLEKY